MVQHEDLLLPQSATLGFHTITQVSHLTKDTRLSYPLFTFLFFYLSCLLFLSFFFLSSGCQTGVVLQLIQGPDSVVCVVLCVITATF